MYVLRVPKQFSSSHHEVVLSRRADIRTHLTSISRVVAHPGTRREAEARDFTFQLDSS